MTNQEEFLNQERSSLYPSLNDPEEEKPVKVDLPMNFGMFLSLSAR